MKSSNRTYVILLTVLVAGVLFFFSTTMWMPDDRIKEKDNYGETITVGTWLLRVDNAKYDKDSKTMTCRLLQRGTLDNPKPYQVTAYLGYSGDKKVLPCTIEKKENDPEMVSVKIKNVPPDYYYISLAISARSDFSTAAANPTDEFESAASSSSASSAAVGDMQTKTVKIDYRTAASAKEKSPGNGG